MIRLDKYLADMGKGTRQEVKKLIHKGNILVNGEVVKKPETKIDIEKDEVLLNGEKVAYAEYEYYMLHKPMGVISASRDPKQATVLDLIDDKKRKDLFPVGRLDKDTEGLLLITNDGELSHRLLSPSKHVDKVYFAHIDGRVTEETKENFAKGVNIGTAEEPEWTKPAHLEILESNDESKIRLTICEGKFHQVKRMFESQNMTVTYLKREAMGSLVLDESLAKGEYRELTMREVENLWSGTKK